MARGFGIWGYMIQRWRMLDGILHRHEDPGLILPPDFFSDSEQPTREFKTRTTEEEPETRKDLVAEEKEKKRQERLKELEKEEARQMAYLHPDAKAINVLAGQERRQAQEEWLEALDRKRYTEAQEQLKQAEVEKDRKSVV